MKNKYTKNNYKKLFLGIGLVSAIGAIATAISCGTNGTEARTDKIYLATAQQATFPLGKALSEAIDIYNEEMKNETGFKEVVFQGTDVTKTRSESELTANVASRLSVQDYANVPNIVLASKVLGSIVRGYQKTMDFTDGKYLTRSDFTNSMYDYNNNLPGVISEDKNIYTIPFSILADDAIAFNLDAMAHIFREIKNNGATIDVKSNIYKKVEAANPDLLKAADETDFVAEPDANGKSIYSWGSSNNEVSNKTFEGVTVNDETFASYEAITDFAYRVSNSLTPADGLKLPSIGMLAYNYVLFPKVLLSVISQDNPQASGSDFLWSVNDTHGSINYKFLGTTDEAKKYQEYIKKAFNIIINNHSYSTGTNKEIPFEIGHSGETSYDNYAAPWQLRRNLAAFVYGPNVEYIRSVNSLRSRGEWNATEVQYNTWLEYDEIDWGQQMFKIQKTDTTGGYVPDGSGLIAISLGDEIDTATKMFLNWLYKGSFKNDHGEFKSGTKVVDFISLTSGYLIGTNETAQIDSENESNTFNQVLNSITASDVTDKEKINENWKTTGETLTTAKETETRFYSAKTALLNLTDFQNNAKDSDKYKLVILDTNAKLNNVINDIVKSLNDAQGKPEYTAEQFLTDITKSANNNK